PGAAQGGGAGVRPGLRAAGDGAAAVRPAARPRGHRRSRHAAAPGGAGLCPMVRRHSDRDERAARAGRVRYPQHRRGRVMFILGLTGSIGMGKSTTARLFAEAGVPVHDADAAVHRLYEGEAVAAIEAAFPGTTAAGRVDREKLAARVLGDDGAIRRLEGIVHPLVRASEERFLAAAAARAARIVV